MVAAGRPERRTELNLPWEQNALAWQRCRASARLFMGLEERRTISEEDTAMKLSQLPLKDELYITKIQSPVQTVASTAAAASTPALTAPSK
jgi:hypothetical protein